MFKKMKVKKDVVKAAVEIGYMVDALKKDESLMGKSLIKMRANTLKSKYAQKVLTEGFPAEAYQRIFRVKEASDTGKHYLDLYLEEL